MGHEFCGRVVDPGDRLDLQVGDRVTALPISPCGECEACRKGEVQYCSKHGVKHWDFQLIILEVLQVVLLLEVIW